MPQINAIASLVWQFYRATILAYSGKLRQASEDQRTITTAPRVTQQFLAKNWAVAKDMVGRCRGRSLCPFAVIDYAQVQYLDAAEPPPLFSLPRLQDVNKYEIHKADLLDANRFDVRVRTQQSQLAIYADNWQLTLPQAANAVLGTGGYDPILLLTSYLPEQQISESTRQDALRRYCLQAPLYDAYCQSRLLPFLQELKPYVAIITGA